MTRATILGDARAIPLRDACVQCVVTSPPYGSGTTGRVASRLRRSYVGLELNPTYLGLSRARLAHVQQELLA